MQHPPNNILPQDLARLSVESFLTTGIVIEPPPAPEGILGRRAGAFVTLRTSDGQLRGCIGTIEAGRLNVAAEIIQNAIGAATRDRRFLAVSAIELSDLQYSVDVLSIPEIVGGSEDLDPAKYGVILETLDGNRRGLLLPGIDGIESVEQQWIAVHAKAGINPGTPVRVERFTVTRFGRD